MKVTEETLDKALELSLNDLKKNLEPEGDSAGALSKEMVLQKAREAVRSGKLDLLTAGNIEQRINRNIPLEKSHRAALGLTDGSKIEGLKEPAASSVASRMGGERTSGRPAAIKTGAPLPQNPVVAEMNRGRTLLHNFQAPNNEVMKVSGSEILERCQQLIREKKMTLLEAGDIERAVNSGAVIRPEVLRRLFT